MTAPPTARTRALAATAGAFLLLTAGWLYLNGDLDRWTGSRALAGACDGVLAQDETRNVLGDGPLAEDAGRRLGEDGSTGGERSLLVRCVIERVTGQPAGDSEVEVTVHGVPTPEARRIQDALYWGTRSVRPVPLGHGWNGFYASDGDRGTAAVLLDCPGVPDDLLVTVLADVDGYNADNPAHRTRVARLGTATAERAADRWDCGAPRGTAPRTVPLPAGDDESVEPGRAKGTCSGVPGRGGTSRVWESPRGDSPREQCALGGVWEPSSVLDAYYGPYAEDMRRRLEGEQPAQAVLYTASALCPDTDEPALYVLHSTHATLSAADARATLTAFARSSATAHGCDAPTQPERPDPPQPGRG
ncbi:hypothetical protein [Streptomyces sp. NPDC058572]|uniref:hypothetical protein n=1 Tax=Streptomyces sp. NPDC058572 TaxID=3346546 RepID=UPI0036560B86